MFTLARTLKAIDDALNVKPDAIALTWNTPVQFEPQLVSELVTSARTLERRIRELERARDAAAASDQVIDIANELHKLRHAEALRLYPLIARGLAHDPVSRRLFWQSRLVMLGLARRVFRRFDELVRALRAGSGTALALEHVARAFAEYRLRNENEIYPLYELARRQVPARSGTSAA